MKKQLSIFFMFLLLALIMSCSKDYNALFQERIAELNGEGKYILNQYIDSVGKEHYIVYIDVDKIVVDTLGDSLQVFPLGKIGTYQYIPDVDFNDGKFSLKRYNSNDWTVKTDTVKKQVTISDGSFYPNGEKLKFSELKCHKRDYVLIPTEKQNIIVFLNKKKDVYASSPGDVQEDDRGFYLSYVGQCRDYLSGMPGGLPAELVFEKCSYDAKMDVNGKIITKSDNVNISGTEIPTTVFGTPEIESYYQKIIADLHPTYYWNCQNCYKVVKSEAKPESGLCEDNFFTGSTSTWTFHRWVRLCKAGTAYTYQCQKCGIQLQTNDIPQMGACREGANHVWSQL